MKIVWVILLTLVALVGLFWLGLQIKPTGFTSFSKKQSEIKTIPLPSGLPAPVERFYRQVYGEKIPVFHSAVLSGRAAMKLFGINFPARFRFVHDTGKAYRHYFEVTWFGIAIFKVNEHYVDGTAKLELPVGVEQGKNIDQAANLALWAEASSFPALFLTKARVRWAAVDDETALLVVPFGEQKQTFVVRFDPGTGLLHRLEAMRFVAKDDQKKSLWIAEGRNWAELNGYKLATTGLATWLEQGQAWATFTIEEIVFNADVSHYVRANGL